MSYEEEEDACHMRRPDCKKAPGGKELSTSAISTGYRDDLSYACV
jgi:hypothetical protein